MNVSDLQSSADVPATGRSVPRLGLPGLLASLGFWGCLLLAAGGYGLATLTPSYVWNQQLKAEYAVADAQLKRLLTQIDRYEQYCRRLTEVNGRRVAAPHADSPVGARSARPAATHPGGWSRQTERGREAPEKRAGDEAAVLMQQMTLEESLQFRLDDVRASEVAALSAPAVSPVLRLLSRSSLARGLIRAAAAGLLLLAFTFCLDPPGQPARLVERRPVRRRIRRPLEWLRLRYRSVGGERVG